VKNDKVRVAVIGVGHLGEYHVQKYLSNPEVELVGVVDTNPDRLREITKQYNVNGYDRYEEMFDKIDAATLAVPTETHFDVARSFLLNGIHLLVEKPITYRLKDADNLIRLASENDVLLQVGLVERFNPAVVKMESVITRPIFIESHRMNLFTVRGTDVDVVLDLMIHDLDIILHMVKSEIQDVHAVGMRVITDRTDIANARIMFKNGTVANLTASRVSGKMLRKIRVFQSDVYVSADCGKRRLNVIRHNHNEKDEDGFPKIIIDKMDFKDSDPLADEVNAFVEAIRHHSEPVVSGQDCRRALEVALLIIDQIRGGSKDS
jgi:predicted dehydrogenase